ncbi:Amino acid/polyamine transporter I [Dillenia turbinata]|uniref:Amino acid/polyamine transporter I n=1 Tax=Dillenia turbinata TaxID=194707 RepID=A0AAN8ZKA0_9MAGN
MKRKSNGVLWRGLGNLMRRKQVDSFNVHVNSAEGHRHLAKRLSVVDLIAVGVGSTIGAGVYILIGTVAREDTGPALTISFLVAGIAAALSALCYAELACRCPSAGSAYHYAYICVGEGIAWLIGWALILEYTIGGSAVARGISPNLALLFGGEDKLPAFLARHTMPVLNIVVDPCAAIIVFVVTGLLCVGIKESTVAQTIVTTINVSALLFIIVAGGYLGFKTGWVGYELPSGYFPFGVNGVLAGSATVFFSYIGFDSVASTAEEVRNPQRDLPLGIGISLSLCCILYMLLSIVIVGLVPYYSLDPDIPISSAFASYGMQWAMYIISSGAVTALCAALMGSILPQPRILMAMARDGLLPLFFSDINERTQVPVKSTVVTGLFAAALAFFMDVSELAGMVSVGTLLAFTIVAVSVLILRYIPPNKVPLPSSIKESIDSTDLLSTGNTQEIEEENPQNLLDLSMISPHLLDKHESLDDALLEKDEKIEQRRRKVAGWNITLSCIGILVFASAASAEKLPNLLRLMLSGVGATFLLGALIKLSYMPQDDARHNFGHSGGFVCPFVPLLPLTCILINTYLLINLGAGTWIRVSVWLVIGSLVYLFYGRSHSSLVDVVYVPIACADKIHRPANSLA